MVYDKKETHRKAQRKYYEKNKDEPQEFFSKRKIEEFEKIKKKFLMPMGYSYLVVHR